MIRLVIVILSLHVCSHVTGQFTVQWLTWSEVSAMTSQEKAGKKYLIDLYTEWCGWCKRMDKNTFSNPVIAEYINKNYIPVRFDAEFKGDIHFLGKTYKYQRMSLRGYHELAMAFVDEMKFPTIVFLDDKANLIQAIPGYQDVESLYQIMYYFNEDYHKSIPWPAYVRNFQQIIDNSKLIDQNPNSNIQMVGQKKN